MSNYKHDYVYSGAQTLMFDEAKNIALKKFIIDSLNLKPKLDVSNHFEFSTDSHISNCIFTEKNEAIFSDLNNIVSIQQNDTKISLFSTKSKINSLFFDEKQNILYCGTYGKKIIVDDRSGDIVVHDIDLIPYEIIKISDQNLVFTDIEKGIYLLNTSDYSIDTIFRTEFKEYIYKLVYNSETNMLFAGIDSKVVAINLDAIYNRPIYFLTSHKGLINNMKLDLKTNKLFTSCQAGQVLIWNLPTQISEYQSTKPVILDFKSRIFNMDYHKSNETLFFNTEKSVYYIPTNYNSIYKVIHNKYNNLEMSQEMWSELIRGNIELPK